MRLLGSNLFVQAEVQIKVAAREALFICSNEYIDGSLRGLSSSVADVEGLASVIGDPELGGFDVVSLVDKGVQEVRVAIARFCKDRKRDDTILVYYSGHGLKNYNGELFLGLRDTQLDVLSATGLATRFLLEELSGSRARSQVIILDCPYASSILRGGNVPSSIEILAASGAMEYAFVESTEEGGSRPKGQFTAGLIEGLRTGDADLDGDGTVTFEELFLYSKRMVESASGGNQSPRMFRLTEKPVIAGRAARPIFISYSRSDTEFASALSDELCTAGHKVWIDTEGIRGGEDWRERIGAAIDTSKLVLAVLSSEAFNSTWVRRELSYADSVGKPILPVTYKACDFPAWYELQFGQIQRLNLMAQANGVESESLLNSVKQVLRSHRL